MQFWSLIFSFFPSQTGAAESPLVVSLAVASIVVISVLVMILCLLVVTLCLRQRKKLMFEIFNEETHVSHSFIVTPTPRIDIIYSCPLIIMCLFMVVYSNDIMTTGISTSGRWHISQ